MSNVWQPGVRDEAGMQRADPWPPGWESLVAAVVEQAASDSRRAQAPVHEGYRRPRHSIQQCGEAFLTRVRERILSEPILPETTENAGLHAAAWAMLVG